MHLCGRSLRELHICLSNSLCQCVYNNNDGEEIRDTFTKSGTNCANQIECCVWGHRQFCNEFSKKISSSLSNLFQGGID